MPTWGHQSRRWPALLATAFPPGRLRQPGSHPQPATHGRPWDADRSANPDTRSDRVTVPFPPLDTDAGGVDGARDQAGAAGHEHPDHLATEGLRWRFVPQQASLAGAMILSVVERDGGFVAVGLVAGSGVFTPAVWYSADGLNWERIEDPGEPISGWPGRAAVVDRRLLLRGYVFDGEANRTTSWESLDGVHWTTLAPGSDLPDLAGAEVTDPVAVAGRRLVVASFHATDAVRSVIYAQFGALVTGRSPADPLRSLGLRVGWRAAGPRSTLDPRSSGGSS